MLIHHVEAYWQYTETDDISGKPITLMFKSCPKVKDLVRHIRLPVDLEIKLHFDLEEGSFEYYDKNLDMNFQINYNIHIVQNNT